MAYGRLPLDKTVQKKKVKNDHRSKFSNLSNWKEEARKKKKQIFFQACSFQLLKLENLLR